MSRSDSVHNRREPVAIWKCVSRWLQTEPSVFDWRLSLQPPAHVGSSLADFSTLKMEAIRSSETSVHTRSTRRHISQKTAFFFQAFVGYDSRVRYTNFTAQKKKHILGLSVMASCSLAGVCQLLTGSYRFHLEGGRIFRVVVFRVITHFDLVGEYLFRWSIFPPSSGCRFLDDTA
jgi:hypothetical protein